MTLNSDFILYHPLWERADNELVNKDGIGVFNRLIDVYVLACSIGIKDDKRSEPDEPLLSPKSIARNTYTSMANTDLADLVDFLMKTAIVTTSHIDLNMDERLKLAFDPDYTVKNFSATSLLNGFANYGIEQIFNNIDSQTPIIAIEEMYSYFTSLESSKYEELLRNFTLEQLSS